MAKYALVKDGEVINLVEWDGATTISWGDGVTAAAVPDGTFVNIGYLYADGTFSEPSSS